MRIGRRLLAIALAAVAHATVAAPKPPPPLATATLPDGHVVTLTATPTAADEIPVVTVTRNGVPVQRMFVVSPPLALQILADRRLSELWTPLLAITGAKLERLRDARLADVRRALAEGYTEFIPETPELALRPSARAAFVLANELAAAGQRDEAIRIAADMRGAVPRKGDVGQHEWVTETLQLAWLRAMDGDVASGLKTLTEGIEPVRQSGYAVNLMLTRAAYLVESGAAADALALVEQARARFDAPDQPKGKSKAHDIAGSNRQFDWLRACALMQLGRRDEATLLLTSFASTLTPRDKKFVTVSSPDLHLRYARCIDDAAMASQVYLDSLRDQVIGGYALVELQPARIDVRADANFYDRIRQDAALAPVLAERMRILPADLEPALTSWQTPVGRWRAGGGSAGAVTRP